jgi:tRNA-specific 2-thiouridylase
MRPSIIVAMSGGVDSAVTAALIRAQGHSPLGVFMNNWDEKDELGVCQGDKDWQDVQKIGQILKMPVERVSLAKEYWNDVFQPFLAAYQHGLTPNPDVWCNRYIKFDAFQKLCLNRFGTSRMATGHYARVQSKPNGHVDLLRGIDPSKDQSYFLCQIKQESLKNVVFPIGSYHKKDIRKIALDLRLPVAEKKESMGICFIGKRSFGEFIDNYLPKQPGLVVDSDGRVLAHHDGIHHWTVGQRYILAGMSYPRYIYRIDKTTIYVCRKDAPELRTRSVPVLGLHWINEPPTPGSKLQVDLRLRLSAGSCSLKLDPSDPSRGTLLVDSEEGVIAPPGQMAAFYQGDVCLGSGVIGVRDLNTFIGARDLSTFGQEVRAASDPRFRDILNRRT